jgi:hypothetical protein
LQQAAAAKRYASRKEQLADYQKCVRLLAVLPALCSRVALTGTIVKRWKRAAATSASCASARTMRVEHAARWRRSFRNAVFSRNQARTAVAIPPASRSSRAVLVCAARNPTARRLPPACKAPQTPLWPERRITGVAAQKRSKT